MTGDGSGSTLEATLGPGPELRRGEEAAYRSVVPGPGEGRVGQEDPRGLAGAKGRSLAHLAQVTDLQLADLASPGRLEFLEVLRGLEGTGSFVPAQRPQEALVAHGFAAVLATLEALVSRDTGAPVDLVVSTGDNLDNAQWNELSWYRALLSGGVVDRNGDGSVQAGRLEEAGLPGDLYWHPDGGDDRWRRRYGFPTLPGLLEEAGGAFAAPGLGLAWCSCFGNHDGLPFGEVIPTPAYRAAVCSSKKPTSLPPHFDPFAHESELFEQPERFLAGPAREVAADPLRRVVGRREFVAAHLEAAGRPAGHGYTRENLEAGTTYFTYDPTPLVRVVVLDTANLDGFHDGSLGARQLVWLEERLKESHRRHLSADGRETAGEGEDRLVVLASHHGLSSLSNLRQSEWGLEDDHPRVGAGAVEALVARFPNVVCWLSGHRHRNEVRLRRSAARAADGRPAGYLEITTCSIADWPSQARTIELVAHPDGRRLSVLTTMVNHAAGSDLALFHRELAGNVPGAGFGSRLEGGPADRNREIVLPVPFVFT